VKVAIVNKDFQDLTNYCDFFLDMDEKSPQIGKAISAGLSVSGKLMADAGQTEKAIVSLKRSVEFSNGELKIFINALKYLVQLKAKNAIEQLLEEYQQYQDEFEVKALLVSWYLKQENYGKCLTEGLALINKGLKSADLFETVIAAAIGMGRRKEAIEELLESAIKNYPEEEDRFMAVFRDTV
jgi:tetratricopeptide (TPR) repeat protein